ncbi:protein of unknown function [Modicisalibacter ilicicola DSM 19980]|uniref:AsmA family protein n=1 Tax=Modicisalibacter ilicicola DSM 19980 TaxID=1121942 RepID=A0A1M4ZUQ0_9GAMM|nr:DUF748 domain-containing protein [Halomonas ilicicola]SHF21783.1 protein of unknown function [Halomonas ilicicola DSM 19980]
MASAYRGASRRGRSSHKRWWLIPLVLAAVAGLAVFVWLWALPYYIEQRLVGTFSSVTGREVVIENVAIDNPFTAELSLEGLRVAGKEQTPVFSSDHIDADVAWRSLWSPGWRLQKLDVQSPRLQLIWQENGNWNLAEMLAADDKNENQQPTPILIERITASDGRLDWINRRIDEPVTLSFEQVTLDAEGYDNTSAAPFAARSESRLDGAALSAEGRLGFSPWRLDMDMTADELPLTALSSYLSKVVRARVAAGTLTTQSRMQAGEATDAGLRITGQGELREVEMLEPDGDRAIASTGRASIEGFLFELDRPRLRSERIVLREPWTEVIIDEQMGTSLTAWLPPREKDDAPEKRASKDASSMRYALDELVVENGAMAFADRHLSEPFEIDFSGLQGRWQGLSSSQQGGGELQLEGEVSDGSPLRIEGVYDPLRDPWQGNLDMHFERMRLATFAPYLRRFAGYEIEQGEVTLDLDYRLEEGRLDTSNKLMLERIRLGEQVDATATDLPVKTLIGVLRNDDGTIELEIPMTIPLDESGAIEFGDIAGQAIRKALQNLVSSPLETLGEVVQGGGNGESDGDGNTGNNTEGSGTDENADARDGANDARNEPQEDSEGLYRSIPTPN